MQALALIGSVRFIVSVPRHGCLYFLVERKLSAVTRQENRGFGRDQGRKGQALARLNSRATPSANSLEEARKEICALRHTLGEPLLTL
jgi:hypothetical protein